MTIAIGWVATRSDGREDLYLASDSRTRGLRVFDLSPKVLMLPRSDAAICFAGETSATYPLILQVSASIAAHQPARERNLDIAELKSHLLRVIGDAMASVRDASEVLKPDDAQFILGGYSWRSKAFRLWTFYYETKTRRFRARESRTFHSRLRDAAFVGDWARRYRALLISELNRSPEAPVVEMEPLGVLATLLKEQPIGSTIGGAPQVVRIGPHMNTRPLCVLWGAENRPHLFGRALFDYEHCDYWQVDPFTGVVSPPSHFVRLAEPPRGK